MKQNDTNKKSNSNLIKLVIALLIFIVIILLTKEFKINTNVTISDYNKIECSSSNNITGEEFRMLFLDWTDLESFQKMTNTSFDTCQDIRDYPQYIYPNYKL